MGMTNMRNATRAAALLALGAAVLADMGTVFGFEDVPRSVTAGLLLVWAIGLSMMFGARPASSRTRCKRSRGLSPSRA